MAALRLWQADVQSRLDGAAAGSRSAAAEVAALRLWQAQALERLDSNAAEAESSQRELGVATALIDGQARCEGGGWEGEGSERGGEDLGGDGSE